LVDFEDPQCCARTVPLAVKRMIIGALGLHVHGSRLRMNGRYTLPASALFDPTTQDTTIQIAAATGELFCQTIAAGQWRHPHGRLYRFRDQRGLPASGLGKGLFRTDGSGIVRFRARGRTFELPPTGGNHIVVTVRVGNECARETMNLRTTRKTLLFP
jgi:hypothetical protein